jgi:hypothetical protein
MEAGILLLQNLMVVGSLDNRKALVRNRACVCQRSMSMDYEIQGSNRIGDCWKNAVKGEHKVRRGVGRQP